MIRFINKLRLYKDKDIANDMKTMVKDCLAAADVIENQEIYIKRLENDALTSEEKQAVIERIKCLIENTEDWNCSKKEFAKAMVFWYTIIGKLSEESEI